MRNLRLDWDAAYDKIDHALRRLAKRQRDAEAAGDTGAPPTLPPASAGSMHPAVARILARRAMKGGNGGLSPRLPDGGR